MTFSLCISMAQHSPLPAILGSFTRFLEFPYTEALSTLFLFTFSSHQLVVSSLSRNHSASQFSPTFIPFLLASCHSFQAHFVILLLKDDTIPAQLFSKSTPSRRAANWPKFQTVPAIACGTNHYLLSPFLLTSCIHHFSSSFIQPHMRDDKYTWFYN